MDPSLHPIFNPPPSQILNLTILDCATITLMDKAHDTRSELQGRRREQWDQHHVGVAFKFLEEGASGKGWHCVWATLAEYDEEMGAGEGACVFRSYDDVYLENLPPRSPTKRSSPKKRRGKADWKNHN
jgi:hypothetical protein